MNYMTDLIFFLVTWVVIFLVDFLALLRPKAKKIMNTKGRKKKNDILEVQYLSGKFKIDKTKLLKTSILVWMAIINSFIISFVATAIHMLPIKLLFQLLIGVVLLFALIYSLYELFGRILVKKGY